MSDLGTVYFDTMKYGAELSPVNGEPGAMLATGWLTAKSGNQITVGDLDLFDETYTLAPDVKVYEFNTDTSTLTARTAQRRARHTDDRRRILQDAQPSAGYGGL